MAHLGVISTGMDGLFCVSALGGAGAHLKTRRNAGEMQQSQLVSPHPPSCSGSRKKKNIVCSCHFAKTAEMHDLSPENAEWRRDRQLRGRTRRSERCGDQRKRRRGGSGRGPQTEAPGAGGEPRVGQNSQWLGKSKHFPLLEFIQQKWAKLNRLFKHLCDLSSGVVKQRCVEGT